MSTSFPGGIDAYTTKVDNVDDVQAVDINDPQDAIVAIETELGTDPAGAFTDVKTRLLNMVAELPYREPTVLVDSANASGVASNFRDNTATYPTGWTQADAPLETNTNLLYSFWHLRGSSAEISHDHRKKSSINLEGITASNWASFLCGPVIFRDTDYTANLDYYFGLYRNNAGAIDTATYARLRLHWDNATSQWQVIGEESDGAAPHSATITLDQNPVLQPLFFRIAIQNAAAKTVRIYIGTTPISKTHQLILVQAPTTPPTWGDVWLRVHQTRGAGVEDYVFIGALDYVGNEA